MKTKEELNEIKEKVEELNEKLTELTEEELAQISGGDGPVVGELGFEVPGVERDYSNSVYGP